MKLRTQKKQIGFSLVEVMVAVAIIGIIAGVAIPQYQGYLERSKRPDAYERMTEIMFQMERFKTKNRTYTTNLTDLGYSNATVDSKEGYYNIAAAACGNGITRCVQLTATPVPGGPQDGDYVFTVNSRSEKTAIKNGNVLNKWP